MNLDKNKDGTIHREQVWLSAWIAVATSSNCSDIKIANVWADKCLMEFDVRFPKTINTK